MQVFVTVLSVLFNLTNYFLVCVYPNANIPLHLHRELPMNHGCFFDLVMKFSRLLYRKLTGSTTPKRLKKQLINPDPILPPNMMFDDLVRVIGVFLRDAQNKANMDGLHKSSYFLQIVEEIEKLLETLEKSQ